MPIAEAGFAARNTGAAAERERSTAVAAEPNTGAAEEREPSIAAVAEPNTAVASVPSIAAVAIFVAALFAAPSADQPLLRGRC